MCAQVRELYLVHVLESLAERQLRSCMVFCSTCRGCHMLALLLAELGVPSVALHSHLTQGRRLAALHRCAPDQAPLDGPNMQRNGSDSRADMPVSCRCGVRGRNVCRPPVVLA